MRYLHPVFMIFVFLLVYYQARLGRKIYGLNPNAPEFQKRGLMLRIHRNISWVILFLAAGGLVTGVLSVRYFLNILQPFAHTFGHGYLATLTITTILITHIIGFSIKNVIKPKIQKRFMMFHRNIIYVTALFALMSLATGIYVLITVPGV